MLSQLLHNVIKVLSFLFTCPATLSVSLIFQYHNAVISIPVITQHSVGEGISSNVPHFISKEYHSLKNLSIEYPSYLLVRIVLSQCQSQLLTREMTIVIGSHQSRFSLCIYTWFQLIFKVTLWTKSGLCCRDKRKCLLSR